MAGTTTTKPTAKDTSQRLEKRRFVLSFAKHSENFFLPTTGMILMTAISVMLSVMVLDWAEGIKPPSLEQEIGISVKRLNQNQLEVMVMSLEKDIIISSMTYNTSQGSGIINRSARPLDRVRDAGEIGIIPVSGYDEYIEITAVLGDTRTIKIFSGKI